MTSQGDIVPASWGSCLFIYFFLLLNKIISNIMLKQLGFAVNSYKQKSKIIIISHSREAVETLVQKHIGLQVPEGFEFQ